MKLTGVSLFAGIGGFDLAMERVGVRVDTAVEIDSHAQSVLRRHFPNTTILDDVTKVGPDEFGHLDPNRTVLTGGFPCQDISQAGNRAGLDGARSGLFFEIIRILASFRAKWVVLENVSGLLSSQSGRDLGTVIRELAELGYGVAWRVLDAQFAGVPQRRRRIFIVGCFGDPAGAAQILFEPESSGGDSPPVREAGQEVTGTLGGGSGNRGWSPGTDRMTFVPDTAATLTAGTSRPGVSPPGRRKEDDVNLVAAIHENQQAEVRLQPTVALNTGGGKPGQGYPAVLTQTGVRRLTPLERERLQGFPDYWTDTQSDSQRNKQLGNAVPVPIVEWIFRRIATQPARPDGLVVARERSTK